MRCASCGTDNAPDSRFCGGCGARLVASGPRVAPTQKIPDDASFAQRPLAPRAALPPVAAPPRMMPAAPAAAPLAPGAPAAPRVRPVTPPILGQPYPVPPGPFAAAGPAAPAQADAARPRAAVPGDLSRSLPVAVRRPWRRIVLVLVLDVGLAASGAYLLRQGLAAAPPAAPTGAGPRSP